MAKFQTYVSCGSLILLCLCAGMCTNSESIKSIRITYNWDGSDEVASGPALALEDSVLRFYPTNDNTDIQCVRILNMSELDSISSLTSGLGNLDDNFTETYYDENVGRVVEMRFEVKDHIPNEIGKVFNAANLSDYLLALVHTNLNQIERKESRCPSDSIYNEGVWNVVEMQILSPVNLQCTQAVKVYADSIYYIDNHTPDRFTFYLLQDNLRDSITALARKIDLNLEYSYWDGKPSPQTLTGQSDVGIRIRIDDKNVATISSLGRMPTKALQELFVLIHNNSPRQLGIYTDCFSGEDLLLNAE